MSKAKEPYVFPARYAGSLDHPLRRWMQKPAKILGPYVGEGMTVVDLGCGGGYYTAELARLIGENGKVIAADLQQGMLDRTVANVIKAGLGKRVESHLCQADRIGISQKVDFVLAFWMIHELPDQTATFGELRTILNPGGMILIVEPIFHVTKRSFMKMIGALQSSGFIIVERPEVSLSRSVLARIVDN